MRGVLTTVPALRVLPLLKKKVWHTSLHRFAVPLLPEEGGYTEEDISKIKTRSGGCGSR